MPRPNKRQRKKNLRKSYAPFFDFKTYGVKDMRVLDNIIDLKANLEAYRSGHSYLAFTKYRFRYL
jgi:hypothetical protein